ncbi:MAG: M48 family metalloprotease [Blastocatellales bacterium]
MTSQALWITTLLFGFVTGAEAARADEVEQALSAIGAGSTREIKDRIFGQPLTVIGLERRAQSLAALPASIREHRVQPGKLQRRVETILSRVLQAQGRNPEQITLFLFHNDIPHALLWRGCVLAISDGLADPLLDGELAGIIAHELGHSFFMDEMVAARQTGDAGAMRVVELKCDAVAILSLKLLDHNPALYLRGLKSLKDLIRRKSLSSGIFQSHPELVERARLSERFLKLLSRSEN